MFGYVKPLVPELKVKQHELYKSIYCSLCKRQKKLTGIASSFTLSYDFVFLALMRSAVTASPLEVYDTVCSYNPLKKVKCIAACPHIDYTAYAATLLTYYKLKDNVNDSAGFSKLKYSLCCALLAPAKKRAVKKCSLPEREVVSLLSRLAEYEKEGDASLDLCADLFGSLLATVSSHGIEDELQRLVLERCFGAIGRWIYIVDAVDDYPDDLKDNSFNPFKGGGLDFEAVEYTLQAILHEVDDYILKIPFIDGDVADVIKNIVFLGTDQVASKVIKDTKEKLSATKGNSNE